MSAHLTIFSALVLAAFAAIDTGDLNCTQSVGGTPAYTPSAVACDNLYDDATCQAVFADTAGTAQPAVAPGNSEARATKCYSDGTAVGWDQNVKDLAIAACPKFCGFCCQTTDYSCTNAPYPRINCATVTSTMCNSALWRTVIASDCPNACGFCTLGGCIDAAPDCATNPSICVTRGLETFVATNCARTCGLCSSSTTSSSGTATSSGTCGDTNSNCATWNARGFCSSTFYSTAQKRSYCGRTCGLC